MSLPLLTQQQMVSRCDLAGVARVVSVEQASPDSPTLVKLAFLRIFKGAKRERGGYVYVRLQRAPGWTIDDNLVSWSDRGDYAPGQTVLTHLDWNGPEDIYETTWPGAVRRLEAPNARAV